jgi:membrane-bound serine protease (ClpP class)
MRRYLKKNILRLLFLFIFVSIIQFPSHANSGKPFVIKIQLNDDTINPITAEYIHNAIDQATNTGAECLIIQLDTPGGLLNSTRAIVKKILAANVPVVVYIAPSGSRAGSAGVFITYASHVAAMAHSTNIGAAHPVQLGEQGKQKDSWEGLRDVIRVLREKPGQTPSEIENDELQKETKREPIKTSDLPEKNESDQDILSGKILHDTVAFIRALAVERHRNVEWAVESVKESSSITETEALEKGVIDLIAGDLQDLLNKIDGRTVALFDRQVTLQTKGARIQEVPMQWRQKFFNILANPNIAYILLILGFYGLLYEVTHPGLGAPGVLGTIFLILAFFSMQTLPTNYAGLALVVLGLILFIAEALTPGFGLLALGGTVSMVLGSLLLFDPATPMIRVSISLIVAFTLTTAAITLFLMRVVFRAHSRKAMSGQEGLIGETAEVKIAITPQTPGKVFVHGELWNATADGDIEKGCQVIVEDVKGMNLKVKKAS